MLLTKAPPPPAKFVHYYASVLYLLSGDIETILQKMGAVVAVIV